MRKSLNRVLATVAATAMVASMFASISPVSAAAPVNTSDTLTREKVSVVATHTLTSALPAFTLGENVIFDYATPGFTLSAGSISCAIGTGTCTATVSSTNTVVVTCTAATCSATTTLGTFSGTNPGSNGSKTISISSSYGNVTGSFAVPIVTDDQITVTASVDPSITFDVGAQSSEATICNGSFGTDGGTVALGTLTTSAVTSSDVSSVNHICSRLSTNATSGAIVTVKSANSALASTSVPGDTIPSASAAMAAGTANYGLCDGAWSGSATTTPSSASPVTDSPFAGTCANDTAAGTVGAVTGTAQTIWHVTGPTSNAFQNIVVKAAISGTTRAHSDYADTLTFVATGTF